MFKVKARFGGFFGGEWLLSGGLTIMMFALQEKDSNFGDKNIVGDDRKNDLKWKPGVFLPKGIFSLKLLKVFNV